MIVRIDYPESDVRLDLWGGTSGSFAGLDQFNRIVDQRWQNNTSTTPADIDRYQYGYDRDSNRLYKANVVGTPIVTDGLDEFYAYDPLNRLTEMQRGVLNGTKTGITGTPSREMDWTLDPTGNWPGYLTKTTGTTDLDQSRTSNTVNEITAITESTGPTWVTPAYDAAGNTTTMPQVADPTQSFTAVYDAWNRMTSISASGITVAKYQYDGRNRRIVKLTYAAGSLSETRHFYFTDQWQDVEERVGTSTSMDKQYVWGMRYVDELVCRDDATPQRLYACQDANFNLTSITDASGSVQERFVYDPYGVDQVLSDGWENSSDGYEWVVRFTGQALDSLVKLYFYRVRYYHLTTGVFIIRDPLQFVDGLNLYAYVGSNPINRTDASGLRTRQRDAQGFAVKQTPLPGFTCIQIQGQLPLVEPFGSIHWADQTNPNCHCSGTRDVTVQFFGFRCFRTTVNWGDTNPANFYTDVIVTFDYTNQVCEDNQKQTDTSDQRLACTLGPPGIFIDDQLRNLAAKFTSGNSDPDDIDSLFCAQAQQLAPQAK